MRFARRTSASASSLASLRCTSLAAASVSIVTSDDSAAGSTCSLNPAIHRPILRSEKWPFRVFLFCARALRGHATTSRISIRDSLNVGSQSSRSHVTGEEGKR
eukprot:1552036-Prymnesium_polylepis.1